MVLVLASLLVHPGQQAAFEAAFEKAQRVIRDVAGYQSHELRRSLERDHHYALLIEWRTLEHHTLGFAKSSEFARWHELMQGHLIEPPQLEYFAAVAPCSSAD